MLASVKWLNQYLRGGSGSVSVDEADEVLTAAGFPIEGRLDVPGGDVQLDIEMTSNRGDCLCHLGLAREIASVTGRKLVPPKLENSKALGEGPGEAGKLSSVDNQIAASGGCPRFSARIIRSVKVGPSPKWMVRALESVGQRSINNIVDVSNYVLLELGHPCHTFDLNTLEEKRIVVRYAQPGEAFTALDGKQHKLTPAEMVVADAKRAVSLAGVIGGLETSVTEKTTDVLLEMATWDPVMVRTASRRLDIRTDASHRFERYVDARDIDVAALRAAELIVQVAGGELVSGMIDEGIETEPLTVVAMRAGRCEHLLGIHVAVDHMVKLLGVIGVEAEVTGSGASAVLRCTIPAHRHDLTREVDIIEEVGRLNGFDKFEIASTMEVHLELSHPEHWVLRERAMDEIGRMLTGMGYYETVTFSFLAEDEANLFCPDGMRLLKVSEERRRDTPCLRPSILPSLLTCRKANQDGRVEVASGIRLFECASVYAEIDDGDAFGRQTIENRNLALLVDAPGKGDGLQQAVRTVRGSIEHVAAALGGDDVRVDVEPTDQCFMQAINGETLATVALNGERVGYIASFTKSAKGGALVKWDLDEAVVGAEVNLDALIALYPPATTVHELPKFPSIERDLSVIVDEHVPWKQIVRAVDVVEPALLVGCSFVGAYRGKQIGAGKKSVTLSLEFRDPERTLRHEEVDPQVEVVVDRLVRDLGAELRGVARAT